MRNVFRLLSVLCVAFLWGGHLASAQAPQYYQYQPQPQPQYRPGAPPPSAVYPGAPPYSGAAPYAPPQYRGPAGPTGPVRGPLGGRGGVSALTVGECGNLGCSVREDSSCPAITHDYHTRHWACQCSTGSSCINASSPF